MNNKTPFNQVFYALVKLVSGEELLSQVCAFEEDDKILVILDYPIMVEFMNVPNLSVPLVKVNPWLNLTEQTTFIIDVNKIITMNEVHDELYINMHKRYVRDMNRKDNKTSLTPNMGYVSSVEEARKKLEETYNIKSENQSLE